MSKNFLLHTVSIFLFAFFTLAPMAGVQSAAPGIDGTWYLTIGDERSVLSMADEGTNGSIALEDAEDISLIDSIEWNAGSSTLSFRQVAPGAWQWYRLRIVDGILKGRRTPPFPLPAMPASEAFSEHVTGWNSTVLDVGLTPRVFDAVLNENYLARIRIDRDPNNTNAFIGEFKVHATMNEGAIGEDLLFDLREISWDGQSLSFQREAGDFWQVFEGTVDGRKLHGTFTQSGTPELFHWSAVRAEVLGRGLGPANAGMLSSWQERTRHRLSLLKMDGNPSSTDMTVNTLQADLPPRSDSQMSAMRDDNPAAWPQAYTLDELEFLIDLPDRHNGGTLTRRAHGYLAKPTGNSGQGKKPAALVLNGHFGSAWGMMDPNSKDYWYGDAFARRGYVVLALDVSHRAFGDDPGNGNPAHPSIASPGYSTDWEEDGERAWTAMRAIDYLTELPNVDSSRLVVVGLSMGGEVASLAAAMDPRVDVLVTAGYSADFNVMAWGDNHPCWEWEHADIREYVDMSDYFSLIPPRRNLIQTGKIDYIFSLRNPPFSADKQVFRRSLNAHGGNSSQFAHHLHSLGHNFRVGGVSVSGKPAEGIGTTSAPKPTLPWDLDWQVNDQIETIAPDLFAWLGFDDDAIFADGFETK